MEARDLLDALDEPAALRSDDGRRLDVNRRFLRELAADGASREDVLDPSRRPELVDDSVLGPLQEIRPGVALRIRGVAVWRPGTAEHRRVDLIATPVPGAGATLVRFAPGGPASRAAIADERQSRRAVVGALAAGVAHDINNQLAASMNIALLLAEELGEGSAHADALEILVGSSREAAELSRRLLRLVGRVEAGLEEIPLGPRVEEILLLLRHELPPSDRLRIEVEPEGPTIVADPARVEHLIALLALPSAEAVDEVGSLEVRVGRDGTDALLEIAVRTSSPPAPDDLLSPWTRRLATELGGSAAAEPADDGTVVRVRFVEGSGADPRGD
ncbi:MAG: hypothetical protein ACF8XB_07360 [Planctomycetota bacterium JB042]